MGGLRKLIAAHVLVLPRRRAVARRHPAVRRLLLEGLDPRRGARARHLRRDPLGLRGSSGVFLTGALHVPHALPRLLGRAERVRAGAPPPARRQGRRRPRCSGRSRCSRCSRSIGGWIQFATVLDADLELPRAVGAAARRGERDAGARVEHLRRRLRPRRHRASRGRSTRARRVAVPRVPQVQTAARAQVLVRRALRRASSTGRPCGLARALEPLDRAAADPRLARPRSRSRRSRPAAPSAACRPACSARTRSRSRAGSPSSSSSSSRCADVDSWIVTILIFLPVAGGARVLRASRSAATHVASFGAARLARRGRLLDRRARALRLLEGPAVRAAGVVVQRPERLVPRRDVRLLALARRPDRRRDGRGDRVRVPRRARPAARLLRADADADRRDRRRLHRRRTSCSST